MTTWSGNLIGLAPGAAIGSGSKMHANVAGCAAAGASAIRAGVRWDNADPNLDGVVDASGLQLFDDMIGACVSNNIKLLLTLGAGNTTMNDPPFVVPYQNFCVQVGRYVAGRVLGIEIGNEPNHTKWQANGPSASIYADQLKSIYTQLNVPTHKIVVLSAGLGGISNAGGDIRADIFLTQMYATWGTSGYFDAFNYHPYTYPLTPTQDLALKQRGWDLMMNTPNQFGGPSIRTILDTHGDSAKPIVVTEYGAPQWNTISAADVVTIMKDGWNVYSSYPWAQQGGGYFWFTYQDKGPPPPPPVVPDQQDFHYGVIDINGSPKTNANPAQDVYNTFKNLGSGGPPPPPPSNCD